jgi:hypothetical protein
MKVTLSVYQLATAGLSVVSSYSPSSVKNLHFTKLSLPSLQVIQAFIHLVLQVKSAKVSHLN